MAMMLTPCSRSLYAAGSQESGRCPESLGVDNELKLNADNWRSSWLNRIRLSEGAWHMHWKSQSTAGNIWVMAERPRALFDQLESVCELLVFLGKRD